MLRQACVLGSLRRASSQPTLSLLGFVAEEDDGEAEPQSRQTRPLTIGQCSHGSPKAYSRLGEIHYAVEMCQLPIAPILVVDGADGRGAWQEGSIYVIVWWNILGQHRGILRPWYWHTTLAKAYGDVDSTAVREAIAAINVALQGLLAAFCVGHEFEALTLASPSTLGWKKSWNFALGWEWEVKCNALLNTAEALFAQCGLQCRKRRPLHISWH